jgi:hypothetical protein
VGNVNEVMIVSCIKIQFTTEEMCRTFHHILTNEIVM